MSTPALNSSGGSILIVDDSAESRTCVRQMLKLEAPVSATMRQNAI